jgi:hypothetical protein
VIVGRPSPKLIDATRKRGTSVIPPPKGKPALINPLKEDPLQFFQLDLLGTFEFVATDPPGSNNHARAEYTLDVLRLNERDYLIKARESAFFAFVAIINAYLVERSAGASKKSLSRYPKAVRRSHHQTVWAEMKRQHAAIPFLRSRFIEAPEVLKW